jgi:hypothetical protein
MPIVNEVCFALFSAIENDPGFHYTTHCLHEYIILVARVSLMCFAEASRLKQYVSFLFLRNVKTVTLNTVSIVQLSRNVVASNSRKV